MTALFNSRCLSSFYKTNFTNSLKTLRSRQSTYVSRGNTSSKKLPFETETKVAKHTEIFRYENPRFFKAVTFFGMSQFILWIYLGDFARTYLRDAKPKEEKQDKTLLEKIVSYENKYSKGIFVLCVSIGTLISSAIYFFALRSVRSIILMKGGEKVRVITYALYGNFRTFEVPLDNLSCMHSRAEKSSYISLKVKGRWMYFLIDNRGVFPHPKLFDNTAGLKRTLK